MRIQKAMTLVTGTVILGLLTACSPSTSTKVLTNSSAKSILASHYAANPHNFDFVYAVANFKQDLSKPTTRNYGQETSDADFTKKLLQEGYLSRSQRMSTVPNISGSYNAQSPSKWGKVICTLNLKMNPSGATVAGSFSEKILASTKQIAITGSITGWVEPDGTVYLIYHANPNGELTSTDRNLYAEYTSYRSNGSPVLKGGQPLPYSSKGHQMIGFQNVTFSGRGPGGYIKSPLYTYTFTNKFRSFVPTNSPKTIWSLDSMKSHKWMWLKPQQESDGKTLLRKGMGTLVVDKVSDLLLDTDVKAHATYNWHIKFNELGRLFAGKNRKGKRNTVAGSGEIFFRKRPDGSWVFDKCKINPQSIKIDNLAGFPAASFYLVPYPYS